MPTFPQQRWGKSDCSLLRPFSLLHRMNSTLTQDVSPTLVQDASKGVSPPKQLWKTVQVKGLHRLLCLQSHFCLQLKANCLSLTSVFSDYKFSGAFQQNSSKYTAGNTLFNWVSSQSASGLFPLPQPATVPPHLNPSQAANLVALTPGDAAVCLSGQPVPPE